MVAGSESTRFNEKLRKGSLGGARRGGYGMKRELRSSAEGVNGNNTTIGEREENDVKKTKKGNSNRPPRTKSLTGGGGNLGIAKTEGCFRTMPESSQGVLALSFRFNNGRG